MNEKVAATTRRVKLRIYAVMTVVATLLMPSANAADDWQKSNLPLQLDQGIVKLVTDEPYVLGMEFAPLRFEGRHEGCDYDYYVMLFDQNSQTSQLSILKTGLTVVSGKVIFMMLTREGKVATSLGLQIELRDLELRKNGTWEKKSAVSYAYLRDEGSLLKEKGFMGIRTAEARTTAGKELKVIKDGHTRLFRFDPFEGKGEDSLFSMLATNFEPMVGFNRSKGQKDVEFSLKGEEWTKFKLCIAEVAGQTVNNAELEGLQQK